MKKPLMMSFLSLQALASATDANQGNGTASNATQPYLFHYEIGSSLDASDELLKELGIKQPHKRKSVIKVTVTDDSGLPIDPDQVTVDIDATNTFWQEKIRTVVKSVNQQGEAVHFAGFRANQGETVYFLIEAEIGNTELSGRFQHRFDLSQATASNSVGD